ncbi:hypothetical protein HDU99_000355, partial [Rhizoclosmatium hyalinum]
MPPDFKRESPMVAFRKKEDRENAGELMYKLWDYIKEKVVRVQADGRVVDDLEAQMHFNVIPAAFRGDKCVEELAIAYVDGWAPLFRNDFAKREGVFCQLKNLACVASNENMSSMISHIRYYGYYCDMVGDILRERATAGEDVAEMLATYRYCPSTLAISLFLDRLFKTPSQAAEFDGDIGKKSAVIKSAHNSMAFIARILRPLNTHIDSEEYGCGGRGSDKCSRHARTHTSANEHKALTVKKKQSYNPHGGLTARLNELLDYNNILDMLRFLFVADRVHGRAGWTAIRFMIAELNSGGRSSDLTSIDLSKVGLMKLVCDSSKALVPEHLTLPSAPLPEQNGDILYGSNLMITGSKTSEKLAKEGKLDSRYFQIPETQHPLMCQIFMTMLEMAMEFHGYLETQEQKRARLPFHHGIAGLMKMYFFAVSDWESEPAYHTFRDQIVKVLFEFGMKLEGQAGHIFRSLWSERGRRMGIDQDKLESLWNFSGMEKHVMDIYYAFSQHPEIVKFQGWHDPKAKSIPIHRKTPIPTSLSSLLFDGLVVEFRVSMDDPEKRKAMCTWFNEEMQQEMYSEDSMWAVLGWWEYGVDAFFYGLAFLRVFEKDLVPWAPDKETGVVVSPVWELLPVAFQSDDFRNVCVIVERQEILALELRKETPFKIDRTLAEDCADVGRALAKFLPNLLLESQTELKQAQKDTSNQINEMSEKIDSLHKLILASTGASNSAALSPALVSATVVVAPAAEPATVENIAVPVNEAAAEIDVMIPGDAAVNDSDFVEILEWGLLTVKYRKAYDPESLPESDVNVPVCTLAAFGETADLDRLRLVYTTAVNYFPTMNRRHHLVWRHKTTNPGIVQWYTRYTNVVAHVYCAMEVLRESGKAVTVLDGITAVYNNKEKFWVKDKTTGNYLKFSLTVVGKAPCEIEKPDL